MKAFSLHNNILFWLGYAFFVAFLFYPSYGLVVKTIVIFGGINYVVLFLNAKYFVPKLYLEKRCGAYAIVGFLFLLLSLVAFEEISLLRRDRKILSALLSADSILHFKKPLVGFKYAAIYLIMLVVSTTFQVMQVLSVKEKKMLMLETQTVESELKFLRSQINPHFLFNALNNVNSLIHVDPIKGSDALVKLADMLRYALYGSSERKVSLVEEVRYIENYIELYCLKERTLRQKVSFQKTMNADVNIEPMILLSFVENSFKHSCVETDPNGFIEIVLTCNLDRLEFSCRNSISNVGCTKNESTGLGMSNIVNRLEMIYHDKFQLDVQKTEAFYSVTFILFDR